MMLRIADITFSYDSVGTISGITFEAKEGEVVSILGPNGVGKSTLLKCIDDIQRPATGTVEVDGSFTKDMTRSEISKVIGYVPQESYRSGSTVFESVLIGRKPHISSDVTDSDVRMVSRIIDAMGLSQISQRRVDEISGGEYQMVQIARALAQRPKVLLLDEPTSSLDLRNEYEIMHLISHIVRENSMTAVMTNHDLNVALRFSDRFILMKEGRIFAAGGEEVITPEIIRSVYGIDVSVGMVDGHKVVVPKELHHELSDKVLDFLSRRKRNPKQKEFFNDRADDWDSMSIHDPVKVEYITDLLQVKGDDSILDVGTGTGVMIPHYLDRLVDGHVTAVDFSENMIAIARSKYPESERLDYKVMDIYDLDDVDRFDKVVCYSCFPHFPDPMGAIEVMSRSIKKGGSFCIAHSSSKEHINHVHETGGSEICTDYLPEMDVMCEIFHVNNLEVTFTRDDDDYYVVIGKKV